MLQGSFQEFITYAARLLRRFDEQLGKEPKIAAHPTPGETDDVAAVLRDSQAIWVVVE